MRGASGLLLVLVIACTPDARGLGPASSTTDALDSTTAPSEETVTPALDSSSGGPALPASCAEILAQDPAAPTGRHTIARADDGTPIDVHCEMELDGGGWTLVARSERQSPERPFGWGRATGTLGDENAPYSLDVAHVGPAFTEILVARRAQDFATPATSAYVLTVPDDFVARYCA